MRFVLARVAVAASLALLAALPAPARAQDRGGYVITSFDADITVEPDSNVLVEERIEVRFSEPRHGIYRTIPVRYSDPKGYAYSLDLRLIGVTAADGRSHRTQLSDEGRYVKIRIGDPDRTVTGTVVYVIRYRVRDALVQFAEHDEIYWNATGHEWNAAIERSSATVRLPAAVAPDELRTAGYTGAFGGRERDVEVTQPAPGVVRFATARPLGPLEGLTVAVGFPPGLVAFPSAAERARRVAVDNWVLLLPLGWLGFLLRRYHRHGRDPDPRAPVMVTYEPPPGLTPGGIGALVDERVDLADITATVVDLAIRRHLTIRSEKRSQLLGLFERDETVFTRETASGQGVLTPHEQAVLSALFASGSEVAASDLANKFYRHLPGIREALYNRLVGEGYFDTSPEKTRSRWRLWGVVAAPGTFIVAMLWLGVRGVGPPASMIVPMATAGLTLLVFSLFSGAMPRRTAKGAEARQWALGFQEFAQRVEGDRLAREAGDPRRTFEALLPFAMALGVAEQWARQFETIYAQAGPAWYVGGDTHGGFSTRALTSDLSSAMSRVGQSMASSPRSSSGSGGGGSSGGGGGGGGGGSW